MPEVTVIAPRGRHSPCVGICNLDQASGYCLGCARTGDEIGRWSAMSEAQRDAVWDRLPGRHEALSIRMRLLPWTPEELGPWVARTVASRLGTWLVGVPGASAEFPCLPHHALQLTQTASAVVVHADDGCFRLELHDKMRAFEFGAGGPIVLGLPKARGTLAPSATFADLGPDEAALRPADRTAHLFDMGLGRRASRFGFRTAEADLIAQLAALSGQSWGHVMRNAGMAILTAHPHRVVESKLARIEAYGPIPAPGAPSPSGVRTHFLPDQLTPGEESPANLTLPDYALPLATFYPA